MTFKDDLTEFQKTHPYKNVDVNGVTFRVLQSGKGKTTLVFLTGGMGVCEMWFNYITALENEFQVLTFDYPLAYKNNQQLCEGINGLLEKMQISYGKSLMRIPLRVRLIWHIRCQI